MQQIEGFSHVFLWRKPGDIVLGRMWSSQDGKGRAKYPMIVCVQLSGVPVDWALEHALPRLEELEAQCKSTGDAAAVRSALDAARSTLRGRLSRQPPSGPEVRVSGRVWGELAECPAMGPDRVGLYRLLYQVERELGDYRPTDGGTRSRQVAVTPQHFRVPACSGAPADELSLWTRAVLSQVTPGTEFGVYLPIGRPWVDVVVGPPDGPQFLFLRASPKGVPLVSDIPYDLDAAFLARASALIAAGKEAPEREIAAAPAAGEVRVSLFTRLSGWARGRTGMILGIVGGGAAVLAGVGLMARGWSNSTGEGRVAPPAHLARGESAGTPGSVSNFDAGPWEELVELHRTWFGLFLRRLDEPPSRAPPDTAYTTRRAFYATDPTLASLLARLDAARAAGPIDPLGLAGLSRGDLSSLGRSPPAAVRSSPQAVARALSVARDVRDTLSGGWPVLGELRSASAEFQREGWTAAAAEAAAAADGVPPEAGRDEAPAVDAALVSIACVRDIAAARAKISGVAADLADAGDPVLASFPAFVNGQIGAAAGEPRLPAMRETARRGAVLAGRLDAFVRSSWSGTDREAFSEGRVRSAFAGSPTWETFESWLLEAKDYPALDPALNPTRSWRAGSRLAEIEAMRKTLADQFKEAEDPADSAHLASLRDRIAALASTGWNRKNQAAIAAGARQVEQDADALWESTRRRLDVARARLVGNAEEARTRLRARVVDSSPALNRAWVGWRDRLVADMTDEQYPRTLAVAREIEGALDAFNQATPAALPDAGSVWSRALSGAAVAHREAAVAAALAPLESGIPSADEVRAALEGAGKNHQEWLRGAASLQADLGVVEARLRGAYGVDEPADGGTLGEAAARIAGAEAMGDGGLASALAPLLARVDAVRRAVQGDPASRAALAAAPETERGAALAAWRSLGGAGDWPPTPRDLALERDAARAVGRIADVVDDPARGGVIRAELQRAGPERWTRCAAQQVAAADFDLVAGAAADFGVTPENVQDPRVRVNLLLARAKAACAAERDDGRARQLAAALGEAIRRVGPVDPRVSGLLDELGALASATEPPEPVVDVTTLGPGSAGWAGTTQGDRVTFTRDGQSIEFLRVAPEGGAPSYLATTETPVGVIETVLGSTRDAEQFGSMTSGPDRQGPRSWMVTPAGFSRRGVWVEFSHATSGAYAMVTAEGAPTDESPMQRVSPAAAVYAAHALGCRLPTAAEWDAALVACGGFGDAAKWNLRDAGWSRWQAAAAGVEASGRAPLWPDADVFWPAGSDAVSLSSGRAQAAQTGDDGHILPAPVGSDSAHPFGHLIGNVAEFLLDPPMDEASVPWDDPSGVEGAVLAQQTALRVVGGSALSPPSVPCDKPQRLDRFDVRDKAGYSDVGFRLAFSVTAGKAVPMPVAVQVLKAIERHGYLPPG
ncbi:MAG: SUMF1/EgtB/PvdO family nonheme iron enzyme [Phycisphaerales bacterium]|nr:SUMF1/EgtB/PvdO family nonheme iron enzyme [Phycisphaerales bacterium]